MAQQVTEVLIIPIRFVKEEKERFPTLSSGLN